MFYCTWGIVASYLGDAVCAALGPVANKRIWYTYPRNTDVVWHGCVWFYAVLNHFGRKIFCHIECMHSDVVHGSSCEPDGHWVL